METYSTGEKFEISFDAQGNFIEENGKAYINETSYKLKEYDMTYDDNKSHYYRFTLSDYINTNDLVMGDIIQLTVYGYLEEGYTNLYSYIESYEPEDDYWRHFDSWEHKVEYSNTESIVKINFDIPILCTSETTTDKIYLNLITDFLDTESRKNHPETKKLYCYIDIKPNNDNRKEAPVNLTFDANGGTMSPSDSSITLNPGIKIRTKATSNNPTLFFAGWYDGPGDDANSVDSAPDTDATLYAHWSDKYYCTYNFYSLVGVSIEEYLKPYKNGYLTYTIIGEPKNFLDNHLSDSLRLYPINGQDYGNTLITDYFTGSYYTKTYSISINDLIKIDEDYTYDYLGFQYVETPDGFVLDKNNMYISYTEPESVYPFVIFKLNGAPDRTDWDRNEIKLCEKGAKFKDIGYNIMPTWEDHTFAGWYYDSELTEPVNDEDTITETITLYAKWTSNE